MWRVYKRGSVWWFDVRVNGERRRESSHTKDRKVAEGIARRLEAEMLGESHPAPDTSIGDAIAAMIAAKKAAKKSEGTIDFYNTKGGHIVRLLGEMTALNKVDAKTVDAYIAQRASEKASSHTIGKELICLRQTLMHARRRGEYNKDPAAVMPFGFSMEYKPRERYLSREQLSTILSAIPERDQDVGAWIAMAVATATRRSEVSKILRSDVNLEAKVIFIRGTKTHGSAATIPIVSATQSLVEHALTHGKPGDKFLPTWWRVRTVLEPVLDKLKIKCSPNDLRRTCATLLVQAGVEPQLIGKLLRHRDSRMVERVYGRMSPSALGSLIDAEKAVPFLSPYVPVGHYEQCNGAVGSQPFCVPRVRIELTTPGFSVLATNEKTAVIVDNTERVVPFLYLERYLDDAVEDLLDGWALAHHLREAIEAAMKNDETSLMAAMVSANRLLNKNTKSRQKKEKPRQAGQMNITVFSSATLNYLSNRCHSTMLVSHHPRHDSKLWSIAMTATKNKTHSGPTIAQAERKSRGQVSITVRTTESVKNRAAAVQSKDPTLTHHHIYSRGLEAIEAEQGDQ